MANDKPLVLGKLALSLSSTDRVKATDGEPARYVHVSFALSRLIDSWRAPQARARIPDAEPRLP
jgi:hypothetical protein